MHTHTPSFLVFLLALSQTTAYSIPSNVQSFYDSIVSAGQCTDQLQSGFLDFQGKGGTKGQTAHIPFHIPQFPVTNRN